MSKVLTGEAFAGSFLKHWGVRGMKWGHRKDKGTSALGRTSSENMSEDAARALALGAKVRSGGTASLTNREMREITDRLNLEQNFARLTTPEAKAKSPMKTGIEWMSDKGNKYGGVLADMYIREQLKSVSKSAPQLVPIPPKR